MSKTKTIFFIIGTLIAWVVSAGISQALGTGILYATLISGVVMLAALLVWRSRIWLPQNPETARGRDISTDTIMISLVTTAVWWYATQILATSLPESTHTSGQKIVQQELSEAPVLIALLSVVIIAPLVEETMFRGVFYPMLRKHWGIISAVVTSSILFAAVHANISQFLFALPVGVTAALMYEITGRLRIAVIIHFFANTISAFVPTSVVTVLHSHTIMASAIVSVCVVAGISGWIYLITRIPALRQTYTERYTHDQHSHTPAADPEQK